MKLVTSSLKPLMGIVLLALLTNIVGTLAELALPSLMSDIINEGVVMGNSEAITELGIMMVIVSLISVVGRLTNGLFSALIGAKFSRSLRRKIFAKTQTFSLADIDHFGTASLITRSTNDVTQIQQLTTMFFRMMIRAPILAIGGVFFTLRISPELSSVILVSLPIMAVVVFYVTKFSRPISTKMQEKIDRVNLVMREKLTGVRVVRAFGNEKFETGRFDEANSELTNSSIKLNRVSASMEPFMSVVLNFTTIAIVFFGAQLIEGNWIIVGDVMAVIQYVSQIMQSVVMLSSIFTMLPRAMTSLDRVNEILTREPAIVDKPTTKPIEDKRITIKFDDVSFVYEGAEEPALENISFTANPGERTAIIGSTGCGKTTLINMILRFYDVTSGSVTFDGVDVRDLAQKDLRAHIGYVPQKASLFSMTLGQNISLGKNDATKKEMLEAVRISQAKDFVNDREEGLDAMISQGGLNLSGGQKQRLAITRAVVRKPSIYIFDDSFSALDYTTDAKLRAELAKIDGDATTIIVAQRVATIMNCDRIVVMNNGRIEGVGTHTELQESCEVYKEIVASQLSAEEAGYGAK